ncbi:UDP-glucoronosyl and UDP-glucosyl transferase [Teladorsagia circumcincta]|uniref:glucuronosyltransferase n=1 Tax=Teladorsagia circumcincta TaxID=45464 RepID=A0A2G9UPU8_TELCI|nr:UDP-glucoronosyl and UDP-glucosyl transferase [Teladorsagia circumcincta]
MWIRVTVLIGLLNTVLAYNYLFVSPLFGHSHSHFMGTIADVLTDAGHNVTVLMPIMDPDMKDTGLRSTKNVIVVPPDNRTAAMFIQKARFMRKLWSIDPSAYGMIELGMQIARIFTWQCEKVFNDDEVMDTLGKIRFDVGIAEAFDMCGFGAMSTKGDVMGMFERLQNVVEITLGAKFFDTLFEMEIAAFRAKFGQDFKDYQELLAQVSYVFTNSNPYLDYPRPTLHKSIDIGGIAVSFDAHHNALPKELDEILNIRETNVIVSFGTVVKSCYMPDEYKKALLEVFQMVPATTFIWKYEIEDSEMIRNLTNVYLSAWLPQNALLADSRISAFVTHGGLGSTTEIAYMGKPAVMVPLFADQIRNANMLAKHGGAIVLQKYDLISPRRMASALESIIYNKSYSMNAKILADMLVNQPISSKQLMLRHAEFAARFGRIPNLDPYGRHLTTMQYYNIDLFLLVFYRITAPKPKTD